MISAGEKRSQYKAGPERSVGRYVEGIVSRTLRTAHRGGTHFHRGALRKRELHYHDEPNSRVCRPFCSAPCGDLFGAVHSGGGASNGHVGAACSASPENSRRRSCKAELLGVSLRGGEDLLVVGLKDLIGSWVSGYSRLDGTIRISSSLGVRWQSWWTRMGEETHGLMMVNNLQLSITREGSWCTQSNRQNRKRSKREMLRTCEIK